MGTFITPERVWGILSQGVAGPKVALSGSTEEWKRTEGRKHCVCDELLTLCVQNYSLLGWEMSAGTYSDTLLGHSYPVQPHLPLLLWPHGLQCGRCRPASTAELSHLQLCSHWQQSGNLPHPPGFLSSSRVGRARPPVRHPTREKD